MLQVRSKRFDTVMNDRVTVGQYLARQLHSVGVQHLFGVPGDFNLALLDEILASNTVEWVGAANELNAAYAADANARLSRRISALVTTYGVGELSAVNGIAGSYAEDVPVVHIVGMPATAAMASGAPMHHTFLDGDFGRFVRIGAEVTAHHVVLTAEHAAEQIATALRAALSLSKPVYIGVPLDVAVAEIDADGVGGAESAGDGGAPLAHTADNSMRAATFRQMLRTRLAGAADVVLLVGPLVHRRALEPMIAEIAAASGVRVATQIGAKAALDEGHPASLGTYMGKFTRAAETATAVDNADVLVVVGAINSDFTTGFYSAAFDPDRAIMLDADAATASGALIQLPLETSLALLRDEIAALEPTAAHASTVRAGSNPETPMAQVETLDRDAPLDQAALWSGIQGWLDNEVTLIAEAGTAFYGALDLDLPAHSDLLGSPVWSSIGYTVPALLGASLARPDRRSLLIVGDGSAQLTVQELGTIYARGLAPVVILINNGGYTVERLIRSPEAQYQDIAQWRWSQVPAALGAPEGSLSRTVRTVGELADVLVAADEHRDVPVFIEVVVPPLDAPRLLTALATSISATNAH